jgi:hypothetical protein
MYLLSLVCLQPWTKPKPRSVLVLKKKRRAIRAWNGPNLLLSLHICERKLQRKSKQDAIVNATVKKIAPALAIVPNASAVPVRVELRVAANTV